MQMTPQQKNELKHLIATAQYFVAVWRVIDAGNGPQDASTRRNVATIVELAIKKCWVDDLRKIHKQFSRYIDDGLQAAAVTLMNDATIVQPPRPEFAGLNPPPIPSRRR